MSTAQHHAEWLSLTPTSGPFLSMPVLLRAFPQGLEPHDPPSARALRAAFEQWEDNYKSVWPDPAIHRGWIEFVLRESLGFPNEVIATGQGIPEGIKATIVEHAETLRPDIMIVNPAGDESAGKPRLLIQLYPRRQGLEKAVEGTHWKASPAGRMTELLHGTGIRLGLITNGEHWILIDAPVGETSGYASWYASLWQEEPLTLRAFRSLLSVQRFFGVADRDTLEALLAESASDQQEVTDQLGYQVRRAVEVLVQAIDRIDKDRGRTLLHGVNEKDLYQAALTVMMRLVFLFSAEERGLLLLGDALYDQHYAVSTLRAQLREAADQFGEEILERRNDAWSRLLATFRGVYGGVNHEAMRLPAYGGALFDPDRFPFLEGRATGEEWRNAHPLPVNNRTVLHLLEALQKLEVKVLGSGPATSRLLSFRALDIEQIGHVYEGLLDHTAVRAEEPVLGLVGTRDKEPEIPLSQLEALRDKGEKLLLDFLKEQTGRSPNALQKALVSAPIAISEAASTGSISLDLFDPPAPARNIPEAKTIKGLLPACDNDAALYTRILPFANLLRQDTFGYPVVITEESVYVTEGTDRRSTGTHYTPKSLTEPIVERTLEPLVYRGFAKGVKASPETLCTPGELLALKICDMATGSGAFLVQACRYLSERLVEAWEAAEKAKPGAVHITPEGEISQGKPTERLIPADPDERLAIARRLVASRCLYGVDKNPMAVEMAKLSLWLITLQKDKPFAFLDHAIRTGDSLVGVDMAQLSSWSIDRTSDKNLSLFMSKLISEAHGLRRKAMAIPDDDVFLIQEKARLIRAADERVQRLRLAGNLIIGPCFTQMKSKEQNDERNSLYYRFLLREDPENYLELVADANRYIGRQLTFHWPLEFLEVFDRDRPGFDAIVGNPPFQGGQKITGALGVPYREYLVSGLGRGKKGSADLVAYFYLQAFALARPHGVFGLLATNTIAQGDTREVGLEQITNDGGTIYTAIRSMKWPGTAKLEVSVAHIVNGEWEADCELEGVTVNQITAFLDDGVASGNPLRLKENAGKSFQGSIVLGMGFVLEPKEAWALIGKDSRNADVLFPYLNGEDLNSRPDQTPSRWAINFSNRTLEESEGYPDCLAVVREKVYAERQKNNRAIYRQKWWQYGEKRRELYEAIAHLPRVLAIPETTKYCLFTLCDTGIIFSHMTKVIALAGLYYWALLNSTLHEVWARQYSSTLETRLKYIISDAFETFPFPRPTEEQRTELERIGEVYHEHRQALMLHRDIGLTKAYNLFHDPVCHDADIAELRVLHVEMDTAVRDAYGWDDLELVHAFYGEGKETRYTLAPAAKQEVLRRLLALNHQCAAEEAEQARITQEAELVAKPTRVRPKTTMPKLPNPAQISTDDLPEEPSVAPAPAIGDLPVITAEDIEPAILTWLVARERDMELIEGMRPAPIRRRPLQPAIRRLHSVRLAKEEYLMQEAVGVGVGSDYEPENWGPLSTTFYAAIDRAVEKGWLIVTKARGDRSGDQYELGQNALEAIEMAFKAIGDRDQAAEEMLFYLDGDRTIVAEQQATIHKVWADLRVEGKAGTVDEVIVRVEKWKPGRPGFRRLDIRAAYDDLKMRGLIR
jgi:hypothetical protein